MQQGRQLPIAVLITGGNICLLGNEETRSGELARPQDLEDLLLYDGKLSIVEPGLSRVDVKVEFIDLKQGLEREKIDSSQLDPRFWAHLAERIHKEYRNYAGFVILHGLDTMAYTASGLAFMLPEIQKPVILTGSQRALSLSRTDAIQNIVSSITLAATGTMQDKNPRSLPELIGVSIFSYDTLFRGPRACMVDASSYNAFDSPNFPPIGVIGEHIDLQTHLIPPSTGQLNAPDLRSGNSAKVIILDVFPGMKSDILDHLAVDDKLSGVLLRTYGLGTAPTDVEVMQALKALTNKGCVVMNVTQARSARISRSDDPVSLRLLEHGVISGLDMTPEAAYAKMVVVLSDDNNRLEVEGDVEAQRGLFEDILQVAQCGEQTVSIFNIRFLGGPTLDKKAELKPLPLLPGSPLDVREIKYAQLRLLGLKSEKEGGEPWNLRVSYKAGGSEHVLVDETLVWPHEETLNVAYDVTSHKDRFVDQKGRLTFELKVQGSCEFSWSKISICIYQPSELLR